MATKTTEKPAAAAAAPEAKTVKGIYVLTANWMRNGEEIRAGRKLRLDPADAKALGIQARPATEDEYTEGEDVLDLTAKAQA